MELSRSAGLLLHPTSLPGGYGIGEIDREAYRWIDTLVDAEQSIWQVLPLGPTGYGDSPYQTHSAFAGNYLLLDMNRLAEAGYVPQESLQNAPGFPEGSVDYGAVISWKKPLLMGAYQRFIDEPDADDEEAFRTFCADNDDVWLHDFALFMAIKEHFGGQPWGKWPLELRLRDEAALETWSEKLASTIMAHKFLQFQFFSQWDELKAYANGHGIQIFGDIPIYVAYDSADVWSNQDLFKLDEKGHPTHGAGVPPDYFSETGQLWGNPIYRWDKMAERGYGWWVERVRMMMRQVDIVRIDHFRGFEAFWEVPAEEETAVKGEWIEGPGGDIFEALFDALGEVPIIAEDLGVITPEVEALRDRFNFPGMKVLQFAFEGKPENQFLPHNYQQSCVVYTGTHDNDTTHGWYATAPGYEREFCRRYLGYEPQDIAWALMRLGMASVAVLAVFPVQDVLSLGSEARMNYPGRPGGNWTWRLTPGQLTDGHIEGLAFMTETYGRAPERETEEEDEASEETGAD